MNTRYAIITISFLERFRKTLEEERLQSPVSTAFTTLLTKEELISVIEHMHEGEATNKYPNLSDLDEAHLLEIIGDEYYILNWLMEEVLGGYTL